MPSPLVNLVALMLLVAQSLVASAPGRVLCIPMLDCGMHHAMHGTTHDAVHHVHDCAGTAAACTHGDTPACSHGHTHGGVAAGACTDVEHSAPAARGVSADHCECHVHVPVPGDEQVQPQSSVRGETPDIRALIGPAVVVLVLHSAYEAPRVVVAHAAPPDFGSTAQAIALSATRLLI